MRTIDGDAFSDWLKEYGQEYIHGKKKISLMYIWKHVQDMPTITPERKRGRWTKEAACEFCGFKPWYERDIHTLSFCPNCGADMRGEQE